jgi:hypothetical protein
MSFASIYALYIQKAEKKGRTKEEVDTVIRWLTGYDQTSLQDQIDKKTDFETFFAEAPQINPNVSKITGVICGYRVEEIEDKLMQKIRYLDKLVDELAKEKQWRKFYETKQRYACHCFRNLLLVTLLNYLPKKWRPFRLDFFYFLVVFV